MQSLKQALERIVEGRDFSMNAARHLESALAECFPEDERFEELEHILASYRPGGGEFFFDENVLQRECARVLSLL